MSQTPVTFGSTSSPDHLLANASFLVCENENPKAWFDEARKQLASEANMVAALTARMYASFTGARYVLSTYRSC